MASPIANKAVTQAFDPSIKAACDMQGAVVQGRVLAPVRPICCKCQLAPCTAPAGAIQRSKGALRRLHVAALQSPQYQERPSRSQYDNSLPRTLRSSIQSVSFNQQVSKCCVGDAH